jgi:hypothetical protein
VDETESTGSEAADTTASDAGPPGDDMAILAELAGEQGAEGQDPTAPAPDDGEKPAGDAPATDKPADGEQKPADAADPAKAGHEAEQRARKILASANRRLAAAQHKSRTGVEAIVRGLKTKPLETLRELGVPIGDILQSGEAEGEEKPKTLEERFAQLESQLQERDRKASEEQEIARIDRDLVERRTQIAAEIKAAASDWPLINKLGVHDEVADTMVAYYQLHRVPCSAAEAAKIVEEHYQSIHKKLSGAPAPSAAPASNGAKPAQQRTGVTLGNTATRNVAPDGDDWPDDIDQRHALAAKELGLNLHSN